MTIVFKDIKLEILYLPSYSTPGTLFAGSSLLKDPEVKAPKSLKELWYILQAPKGFNTCKFPLVLMGVIIGDLYFKGNELKISFYFIHFELLSFLFCRIHRTR